MFDNVLITDSKRVAEEWAADSWAKKALQEKMGEGMAFFICPLQTSLQPFICPLPNLFLS